MTHDCPPRHNIRVVVSAYACDPSAGSEPGAGWAWVRAGAEVVADLTVVTRDNNVQAISAALDREGTANVTVIPHEGPEWGLRLKKRVPFGTQLYYLVWQLSLARRARREWVGRFDVAHHLTFAVDWMPAGIVATGSPYVWGPVGGASHVRIRHIRLIPRSDRPSELVRNLVTAIGRAVWGRRLARNAAECLFQNADELAAFGPDSGRLVPNVVAEPPTEQSPLPVRNFYQAVVVGRLIGLKGVHLALASLTYEEARDWRLLIIGDGPLRRELEQLAASLGITARVRFVGQVSRTRAEAMIAQSDALVSASLHEAAGFAVAEAVAAGCPVIYVDAGGPGLLVPTSRGVALSLDESIPKQIALALRQTVGRHAPTDKWSASRLPPLLSDVYGSASGRAP